jgi:hypothetical protein
MFTSGAEPQEEIMNAAGLRVITVGGLLVASAGIMVQGLSGVTMPVVPPAVVLMVLAALLITVLRWRWLPVLGVLAAAAELAGFAATGAIGGLFGADNAGVVAGAWLRLIGTVAAVPAALALLITNYRKVGQRTA